VSFDGGVAFAGPLCGVTRPAWIRNGLSDTPNGTVGRAEIVGDCWKTRVGSESFCWRGGWYVLSTEAGGTPTMMGQQERTESLFHYFRRPRTAPSQNAVILWSVLDSECRPGCRTLAASALCVAAQPLYVIAQPWLRPFPARILRAVPYAICTGGSWIQGWQPMRRQWG